MTSKRISQTREELHEHLTEQLQFLRSSAEAFDRGFDGEAKRLAVTIRLLLHDTPKSHSLLGQVGERDRQFLSTAIPHEPTNIGTHGGLVMIAMKGSETRYVAMLDDVPITTWVPFDEWWQQDVFVDDQGAKLSRKSLILTTANQDGGAHVDPALDETYARLSRQNSLGWIISDGQEDRPIPKPERAAVRQIAHEVLRTLIPDYRKKPNHRADLFVGGAMVFDSPNVPPLPIQARIGRNDPCPCGSGRKYKKCHGRTAGPPP